MSDASGLGGPGGPGADQFELLVASVVDYAIFLLDAEGRVASWNPGAQRLKGYPAEEILGQHFSRFYPMEDVEAGKPERELAGATAQGRIEDEGWRVRKDGSLFWANVVITALRDEDGTLLGFAKITRDLTERKRAEDVLRESEAREREAAVRLRQLDQMKNEFVAMVAHDLNSPLAVATGFVDLVLSGWDELGDAEKRSHLERVRRTTVSLTALVNDILSVGRIESGELDIERQPFDLSALLHRAASEGAPPDRSDRIRVQVEAGAPMAMGDERRVWQVVMNLLSNALKFSPTDRPVELRLSLEGAELVVSVRDHGSGIASGERERVFERFVRVAQPETAGARGSGLGLYISRSLIEAQGGRIWVESEIGRGAMFRFTLPVAPGEG
jgi:PAS domain S-box-containing protein